MEVTTHVPPLPPWRRPKLYLIVGIVVVLVAGGFVAWRGLLQARQCAEGVARMDNGECVGVTDGSFEFDPGLAGVQRLIHAENEAVRTSGKQYVSVALMVAMTLSEHDSTPIEWVRHHLQGAYLAQYRANHDAATGDQPQVRLLLANPGTVLAQWAPVVEELDRRKAAPDNLVAVTGFGLSLASAKAAMVRLSELNIPVFASTPTSDDLRDIKGLLRMAPANSDQARAAANYVKATATTALLIQDNAPAELYPKTLADSFTATFIGDGRRFAAQGEYFDSRLEGVGTTFLKMIPNICTSRPDVVYFAGRGKHLLMLVAQLTNRNCKDLPIRILTGDDLSTVVLPKDDAKRAREAGVELLFTVNAHPDAWEKAPQAFDSAATSYLRDRICTICFPAVFPDDSLEDGSAILSYDAVVTAVRAIRNAVGNPGERVTHEKTLQQAGLLHDQNAVAGASGRLSFDPHGSPIGKVVPIMRLTADGTAEFVHLASA